MVRATFSSGDLRTFESKTGLNFGIGKKMAENCKGIHFAVSALIIARLHENCILFNLVASKYILLLST
jgi:hypothetical protein